MAEYKGLSSFQKAARAVLIKDEGIRYYPYRDTEGNWTCGVGHYIGKALTDFNLEFDDCMHFLDKDIEAHVADLHDILGEDLFESLPLARQMALVSLAFTMSKKSVESFTQMIAAVKDGQWAGAAEEVLNSKWAHDVDPRRSPDGRDNRVAYMLKTGKLHPDYDL